jgi:predicted Zn-ribbon and HTH transcriptional regulator
MLKQVAKIKITVDGYRCERCGYEWVKRKSTEGDPEICPKCKSARWHTPRKSKGVKK